MISLLLFQQSSATWSDLLILKRRPQFNDDAEIRGGAPEEAAPVNGYCRERAAKIKSLAVDRVQLATKSPTYEPLDQ
jgi:hypothetical protein